MSTCGAGAERMESLYRKVLGPAFGRLQPELQEYFSLLPGSGSYGVGTGTFDVAGCPQAWLRPLLRPAGREEAFFPEYGTNIGFRIENHSHLDPFGRPSLTARREIRFPRVTRIFSDTTSLDTRLGLLDYVGAYRRLVTDLELSVTAEGYLRGVSQKSRALLGPLRVPLPAALDAKAYAEQRWDAAAGRFRIQVKVIQPLLGTVLVYAGAFDYRLQEYAAGSPEGRGAPGSLPPAVQPRAWHAQG
ncbi:DUF4166 domain-containing protein [Paenarthrobacter sp. DKR-5]|nr:DUF4166 domain-containing protein [Paenarthrobacter sp. DKR-5]